VNAQGILNASSDNSPVINTGTITTMGNDAVGIVNAISDSSSITNTGSIWTKGVDAYGIYSFDNSNSAVSNSGRVVSEQSFSIVMEDADGVLNLNAPGFIGGEINFVQATTVNLTTGPSHSVLWDLSTGSMVGGDPASIAGPVPWFYNSATKQFATYDPSGLKGAVNELGDLASLLSTVGRNGLGPLTQPASSTSSVLGYVSDPSNVDQRIADAFGEPSAETIYGADLSAEQMAYGPASGLWITGFGGALTHEGDNATLEQDIDQMGVAAGYTWQHSTDLTLGVMAGYVQSSLDTGSRWADSHAIDSHGWFVGANGRQMMGGLVIDFGVTGGMLAHDSKRLVNDNLAPLGVSYANANYDSWFITPELNASMVLATGNGVTYTPSAGIRYTMASIDGFTETGSAANAEVGSRDIGLIEANVEMAATKQVNIGTVTGRIGYMMRHNTGDDAVSISLIGINNSVGFGDTDSHSAYIGLGTNIELSSTSSLVLDAKGYFGGDINGYQGMAKFVMAF